MLEDKKTRKMLEVVDASDGDSAKRSYQSPQLRIYGDIREVTQGTGHNSARDANPAAGAHKSLP